MSASSRHIHLARTARKATKAPSPLVAKLIYVVAVAEPLANLPQIHAIFTRHTAAGVSLTAWLLYAFFAASWLTYGINTRQKAMIIGSSLILLTDLCVVAGGFIYGGKL